MRPQYMQKSSTSAISDKLRLSRYQIMRPLKSKRRFKYCVMDIEAEKWTKVKLIGFYDGKEYRSFRNMDDFLFYFLRQKYSYWRCFAHFGAGYDFNFVLSALEKSFPNLRIVILSNNGASMVKIYDRRTSKNRAWIFLDSYRLLPRSLYELTKSFDVEHKKLEIDYENISKDKEKLALYLKHDCLGLYEVLKKFEHWFDDYQVALKPTIASQAMATYRKMMKISIPILKPHIEDFVRKSYYGGRVEVFKLYCNSRIYSYDVRSLYPYAMKKYPMPVGSPVHVKRFHDDVIGFYHADIKVPDMYFPPLPIVLNKKLLFPCGKFSGYYASKELEIAQLLGCDVSIKEGYVFPDYFMFDDYVDKMFALKESGDGATKTIAKLLLNSLYGKFGQNRNKKTIIKPSIFTEAFGLTPYNEEHGLYQKESVSMATFIIPSIASWITSCARSELFQWLLKAGEESTYYCDTDSIFSTKQLPTGKAIGNLKLEEEGDEAIFLLPKLYALKNQGKLVLKAKGFDTDFIKGLTFEAYRKALNGDKSDFFQTMTRFGKFKEALVRSGEFVSMLEKKKSIKADYSKRTVENFDTHPLKISI